MNTNDLITKIIKLNKYSNAKRQERFDGVVTLTLHK